MSDIASFLNMSEEEGKSATDQYREKNKKVVFAGGSIFNVSKIKPGKSATFRFLPADPAKKLYPDFTVVKKIIPLSFVDPTNEDHFVRLSIPVREMYDPTPKSCPAVNKVRPLYEQVKELKKAGKETEAKRLHKLANEHWIDPEYIGQGFVVNAGYEEENIPENPIRRTYLKKTLFKLVDAGMNTDDVEARLPYWPCHPKLGFNFIIKKTVKQTEEGPQNSYEQSSWARSPSPLTDEQIAAIEKYGIPDLTLALPARPTDEEYAFLAFLVEQSIAGNRTWDPSWESELKSVKPFKVDREGKLVRADKETTSSSASASSLSDRVRDRLGGSEEGTDSETVMGRIGTPREETAVEEPATPAVETVAAKPGTSTADLAAKIRARMAAKKTD